MRYAWLWIPIALAGCASPPERVKVEVERVEVPIPVPCLTALPDKPAACNPADAGRPEYLRCRLVDADRAEGYIMELEAALSGCVRK